MRKFAFGALCAASMFVATPAVAQELPVVPGDYWNVTGVKIDDGHFAQYADFLANDFRRESDFAKSKGWIKGYYILSNVNARKDEPDLYLVRILDHVPTPAEALEREKETNAFMKSSTRQAEAQSGARASFRHLTGNELLQVMNWVH